MADQGFFQRVYAVVARVPEGRVVTYGQVARCLGSPRASRAVGYAMRHCPEGLPWHRVVNAVGQLARGSVMRDVTLQRAMLEDEGVAFGASGAVDLSVYGWDGI